VQARSKVRRTPPATAILVANTLKDLGFNLINHDAQLNLNKSDIDKVVQEFGKQLQGADVALFYYAGHGIQLKGSNYRPHRTPASPVNNSECSFIGCGSPKVSGRQMSVIGTKLA
jgi:hypothetical protein